LFFKFAFASALAVAVAVAVAFAPAFVFVFVFTHASRALGTVGEQCSQTKNSGKAPHLIPYSARKGQIGSPP
jgi:ABC-type uncharacterized transport system permease subunit